MDCARHGGLHHAAVHETGHALAALERGIRFVEVELFPNGAQLANGLAVRGCTRLDDGYPWRTLDPLLLFEFVIAGSLAEDAVLGDRLPGGWDQDVTIWRQCVGLFRACTEHDLRSVLGESPDGVIARMRKWASDGRLAIQATAERILVAERVTEKQFCEFSASVV